MSRRRQGGRRRIRGALACALALPLACAWLACQYDFTIGGRDGSSIDGSAGDGTTTTEAGAIATCAVCLPPAPNGWEGPFAVDESAGCGAGWPSARTTLHAGVDGGAFSCACNCTTPPASCVVTLANDNQDFSATCAHTDCATFAMSAGECRSAAAMPDCQRELRVEMDGGGPCTPDLQKVHDTPGWARTANVCAPNGRPAPSPACKQGEICVPERPASAALCILHAGPSDCPPGWTDTSSTYYAGYDDTRDCTACSCGSAGEPCELAKLWTGCTQDGGLPVAVGECADLLAGNFYRLLRTARACAPDGGAPAGALTATGETTICCRRP